MRIGALCRLCMSRYVGHILSVQEIEVASNVSAACHEFDIRYKQYSIVSPGLYSFFLRFQHVVYIFVFRFK